MKKYLGVCLFIIPTSFLWANTEVGFDSLKDGTKVAESIVDAATRQNRLVAAKIDVIVNAVNPQNIAYVSLEADSDYFAIYDDSMIRKANISTKQYFGSWPLGASDPCENSTNPDCASPWWTGRWNAEEFLEEPVLKRSKEHGLDESFSLPVNDDEKLALGCLTQNPLRYGDLTGDEKNELAIIFKNDIAVFSPERKKTIFAVMYSVPDWMPWAELIENGLTLDNNTESPQYGSRKLYDQTNSTSIAHRGYGKLYFGYFDGDSAYDILVWRKFYLSRLVKDPVKGFEKISDTYIHYKLVDGEYKKQPTEQAVVKGWLEAKNLTWQKGYPSKSECPGQEGQLIPEMHDPLLNDPDVLK